MKYKFTDAAEFAKLEDSAIDGQLNYDKFPPAEYRYFSQLAKLGWLNRHKGWSKELCEQKQEEHRKQYADACAERDEWLMHRKRINRNLVRTTELSRRLNFAKTKSEALQAALELIEALAEEPNLAKRIMNNLKEETQ